MVSVVKGGGAAGAAWALATAAANEVAAPIPTPAVGPTWSQLSMLLGAVVFGLAFTWYAKRVLVSREEYDALKSTVDKNEQSRAACHASCVQLDRYEREHRGVSDELEKRRTSVRKVHSTIARVDRRAQRLELHVTAIAVKLGVDIDMAEPPLEPQPEEGEIE